MRPLAGVSSFQPRLEPTRRSGRSGDSVPPFPAMRRRPTPRLSRSSQTAGGSVHESEKGLGSSPPLREIEMNNHPESLRNQPTLGDRTPAFFAYYTARTPRCPFSSRTAGSAAMTGSNQAGAGRSGPYPAQHAQPGRIPKENGQRVRDVLVSQPRKTPPVMARCHTPPPPPGNRLARFLRPDP
jgi:hypothetical protein